MAIIKSGASTDQLTIDTTSKAARVTLYKTDGTLLGGNSIPVNEQTSRTISGVYSFTLTDVAGVASANVFMSIFNPIGSGKKVAILKVDFTAYAVAITIAKVSKRLSRISTATVGTLQATSAFLEHKATYPPASAEVRTGNPTVTQVADGKAFPPSVTITAAGAYATSEHDFNPKNEDGQIILEEGEGISIYQNAAGDTDETMQIRVNWMEYT